MITRNNIDDILYSLSIEQEQKLIKADTEYFIIRLSIFNAGYTVEIECTDNLNKHDKAIRNGNAVLNRMNIINKLGLTDSSNTPKI